MADVAISILLGKPPDLVPGADVGPTDIAGRDRGALGFFHDSDIDWLRAHAFASIGTDVDCGCAPLSASKRRQGRVADVASLRKLFQHYARIEEEDAGVPGIIALIEIMPRGFCVWFFTEGVDRKDALRQLGAAFDVT